MLHLPTCGLALFAALFPLAVLAQNQCDESSGDCAAIGRLNLSLSFGYGQRSNPLDSAESIPLYLTPQISFYGERFFIDNLDIGYTLFENDSSSINIIATPVYDRVFFERDDPRKYFLEIDSPSFMIREPGPGAEKDSTLNDANKRLQNRERDITYLGGLEIFKDFNGIHAQLSYGKDLTNTHRGQELRVAVAIPLYQGTWQLGLSTGATWKSSKLVSYYYGDPEFLELKDSVNPFLKLGASKRLSKRWDFRIITHVEHLGLGIRQSPIVDNDYVRTFFIGGTYHFK